MGVVPEQCPGSHIGRPTWSTTCFRLRSKWGQWGVVWYGVV